MGGFISSRKFFLIIISSPVHLNGTGRSLLRQTGKTHTPLVRMARSGEKTIAFSSLFCNPEQENPGGIIKMVENRNNRRERVLHEAGTGFYVNER